MIIGFIIFPTSDYIYIYIYIYIIIFIQAVGNDRVKHEGQF